MSRAASGACDFATCTQPQICVRDGAGRDTPDVSGYCAARRIDLNDRTFSDVGGFKGNGSIDLGAPIANAVGGTGNDTLVGNESDNGLPRRAAALSSQKSH